MLPRARFWWRSRPTGTDGCDGEDTPLAGDSGAVPSAWAGGLAAQAAGARRPRPSSPDAHKTPLTLPPEAMTHPPAVIPLAAATRSGTPGPGTAGVRANGAAWPPAPFLNDHPAELPTPHQPDPTPAAFPDPTLDPAAQQPESAQLLSSDGVPHLYLDHFGFTSRPFTLEPHPGFLFWSRAHSRAYSILEYGILTRAPITLITGEVGAGKTTLIHHLLRRLGPGVRVGLVSNAHGARGELLRWIMMALGQSAPEGADYVTLFAAFQRLVIDEYAAGHRVVLIFDEAQNLGRDVLEELRLLTNINANGDELLQLILVGQPELRDIIHRPDMAQFTQRVAARFHLPAMDAATMRGYVEHRLTVAGAPHMLFDDAAVARIHRETRGVPRLVNQLCDLALVYAFTEDAEVVTEATVANVLDDGVFVAGPQPAAANDNANDQFRTAEADPHD